MPRGVGPPVEQRGGIGLAVVGASVLLRQEGASGADPVDHCDGHALLVDGGIPRAPAQHAQQLVVDEELLQADGVEGAERAAPVQDQIDSAGDHE